MLFENITAPLNCHDCKDTTNHAIQFIYFNAIRHSVRINYYCQECFETSLEFGTEYTLFSKEIPFRQYYSLCITYGVK